MVERFSINVMLTDSEVGKLLHIMRIIRNTSEWTEDAKTIVVKIQCAVEDLGLLDKNA